MFHTIRTFTRDGFDICFSVAPEQDNPNDHFDDDGETARAIANGEFEWFIARVNVSRHGIELGDDYLGGCCYKTFDDFMTDSGYFEDMISGAIAEAETAIRRLCGTADAF